MAVLQQPSKLVTNRSLDTRVQGCVLNILILYTAAHQNTHIPDQSLPWRQGIGMPCHHISYPRRRSDLLHKRDNITMIHAFKASEVVDLLARAYSERTLHQQITGPRQMTQRSALWKARVRDDF